MIAGKNFVGMNFRRPCHNQEKHSKLRKHMMSLHFATVHLCPHFYSIKRQSWLIKSIHQSPTGIQSMISYLLALQQNCKK